MVAREVKDTIDKEALYRVMHKCYDMHQIEKPKWNDFLKRETLRDLKGAIRSAKSLAKESKQYMKEKMVGPLQISMNETDANQFHGMFHAQKCSSVPHST